MIFLRARVSLALLSLRTNGGLLVVRRYWVPPIVPLFSGSVSNIWSNVAVPTTQTHLLRLNFMVKFKLNFAKKKIEKKRMFPCVVEIIVDELLFCVVAASS